MRQQKHYCRHCLVEFVYRHSQFPVHDRMYTHVDAVHPDQSPMSDRCSKYCSEREQPEEKRAGAKLYGPGRQKVTSLIKTFEELFPAEEDDHT